MAVYGAHQQRIMQALISAGYPPHIAAGYVGNAMQESGPSINPAAYNKDEGALGAFQWRLDRRQKLEALAAERRLDAKTLDAQIPHFLNELSTTYKSAAAKINQAQTPEEAAALVDRHYENSALKHTPERQAYARQVYDAFMAQNGQTPDGPGPVYAPPPPGAISDGEGASMLTGMGNEGGGLLDMMGDPSLMDHAFQPPGPVVAPTGATPSLMEEGGGGSFASFDPSAGLAALGEAIAASAGGRPMDLTHAEMVKEQNAKRVAQVNEREALIQYYNDQGMPDLARALVNGTPVETVETAYKERAKAYDTPTSVQEIERFREMVSKGDPLAEAFGRKIGAIDDGQSIPDLIEVARWMSDPTTPPEQIQAARDQMRPDALQVLDELSKDPELLKTDIARRREGAPVVTIENKTETAGAVTLAEEQGKRLSKYYDEADAATARLHNLAAMTNLLDTGMETGTVQGLLSPIKAALHDIGIEFEEIPGQQAFQSMQQGMLPQLMSGLKGAASDFESRALLNAIPSIDKDEVANRILIQSLRVWNELERDKADFMERYFVENNHSLTGGSKAWEAEKRARGTQIFKQFESKAAAIRAIAAGEVDVNEVILIGDKANPKGTEILLGRHLRVPIQ